VNERLKGASLMMCPKGHIWQRTATVDRCPRCHAGREHERNQDPYRKVLHSARWQKTRKLVRARDKDQCQLEGVGDPCGGRIEVHHIVGVRQGGAPFDPANCACLCRLHHEDVEHGRLDVSELLVS
jgi:5-methylcytosine-specific restriction endonuclease McrA